MIINLCLMSFAHLFLAVVCSMSSAHCVVCSLSSARCRVPTVVCSLVVCSLCHLLTVIGSLSSAHCGLLTCRLLDVVCPLCHLLDCLPTIEWRVIGGRTFVCWYVSKGIHMRTDTSITNPQSWAIVVGWRTVSKKVWLCMQHITSHCTIGVAAAYTVGTRVAHSLCELWTEQSA